MTGQKISRIAVEVVAMHCTLFIFPCSIYELALQQHYAAMPTTLGTLDPPLGNARLQTVRLMVTILNFGFEETNVEMEKIGMIPVIFVSGTT